MRYWAFILSFLFLQNMAKAGEPVYAFAAGISYTGLIEFYSMDENGSITLSSKYNIWKDYPSKFGDPADLAISPKGDALFITDFNNANGAIFGISGDFGLTPRRRIDDYGCLGGGFSWDGAFGFSTKGVYSQPAKPVIQVYDMSTSNCAIVSETEVPTTAAIRSTFHANSQDRIVSSAFSGILASPPSMVVYEFNRKDYSVHLKQYALNSHKMIHLNANNSKEMLIEASDHYITILMQQSDGTYKETSTVDQSSLWYAWGYGGVVTPDGQYAVAIMFDIGAVLPARPAGAYLFKITPAGELIQQSLFFQKASEVIGMTPDGKYIVVSSEYGTVLTVFRINRTTNQLEVVHTMPHPDGRMQCMAFFQNKRPKMTVKEKSWSLYSDSIHPSQQIAQTPEAGRQR